MARVVITTLAGEDTREILTDIAHEAGYRVSEKYNAQFENLYERLSDHPKSC